MRYLSYLDRVFGDHWFSYEAIKYHNLENSWLINIFWYISDILGSVTAQYIFISFIFILWIVCAYILSGKFTNKIHWRLLFALFWVSAPWVYSRGMRWQFWNITSYMIFPIIIYMGWLFFEAKLLEGRFSKKNVLYLVWFVLTTLAVWATNIRFLPIAVLFYLSTIFFKFIKNRSNNWRYVLYFMILYVLLIFVTNLYRIIPFYDSVDLIRFTSQDLEYFSPDGIWYEILLRILGMAGQGDENRARLYPDYHLYISNILSAIFIFILFVWWLARSKITLFDKILLGWVTWAVLFATWSSIPLIWDINRWIVENLPGFSFYREPWKRLVWVPMVYIYFIYKGILLDDKKIDFISRYKVGKYIKMIWFVWLSIVVLNNSIFYIRNWFADSRYIVYPDSWYKARNRLSSNIYNDNNTWTTISLPRHRYIRCDFTHGMTIQNPVWVFFWPRVIYGDNIELDKIYTNINSPIWLFFESRYKDPKYYYDRPDAFLGKLRSYGVRYIVMLKNDCAKGDIMIDFIDKYDQAWLVYYKVFDNEWVAIYKISD